MKQKLPLSVVIITHRKDERFERAVASAQKADEVLIADYSHKPPIADFSAARNTWLAKAQHEWVLFLDSDEVIEQRSWPHLEKVMNNPHVAGAYVRRTDVFYGRTMRYGETGKTWILRLVKKSAARFTRPVHEIAVVDGLTVRSGIRFQHFSHPTVSEFLQAVNRYSNLEAEFQNDSELPVWLLAVKIMVFPTFKFLQNFIFRLGFLDGWRGGVYAVMMSLHSVFVRIYSYENRT